jgi:hypothetical protein
MSLFLHQWEKLFEHHAVSIADIFGRLSIDPITFAPFNSHLSIGKINTEKQK